MGRFVRSERLAYVALGFFAGVFVLVSCGGGSAVVDACRTAAEIVFDGSTSTLTADNVQSALEEVSTRTDDGDVAVSALDARVSTNEADISATQTAIAVIESRLNTVDSESSALQVTAYNQDISSGLALNVAGRGRDLYLSASINVNNTVDVASPHDTTLILSIRMNNVVRQQETVTLKANSRHVVTLQWLEVGVSTATHTFDVVVSATNRVDLEQRALYVIEL